MQHFTVFVFIRSSKPLYWHRSFTIVIKISPLIYLCILLWCCSFCDLHNNSSWWCTCPSIFCCLVVYFLLFMEVMWLKAFQQPDSKANLSKSKVFILDLPSYISTQSHSEKIHSQRRRVANLSTSRSLYTQKCIEATGWVFVNFSSVDPAPSLNPSL